MLRAGLALRAAAYISGPAGGDDLTCGSRGAAAIWSGDVVAGGRAAGALEVAFEERAGKFEEREG